ncbi:MAG: FecR domain-containing protein [Bacteroidetes bacterium]|nr:FecR domain-containing protein [Bacteroidota bacterium]
MQHSQAYYKELLSGFILNSITPEQVKELYRFIEQEPGIYEQLMSEPDLANLVRQSAEQSPVELQPDADQRIWAHLQAYAEDALQDRQAASGKLVALPGRRRSRIWIAAAVLIPLAVIATFLTYYIATKPQKTFVADVPVTPPAADVPAPQVNHATITLANGQQVSLDSLNKGLLAQQGNTKLVKLDDGRIAYQSYSGEAAKAIQYNTLFNPRGSKAIDMVLSDGTHIWLNAASSITYPVSFAGKERKVSITGEAYFEVASNASSPFYVSKGEMEIKVLGTSFNVNTYDDEEAIKITLIKGAVRVSATPLSVASANPLSGLVLKPGEQATLSRNKTIVAMPNADLAAVMAWKDGLFNFNKASLQDVMRQLARWYDVEVEYRGAVTAKTIGGEMQRDLSLTEVLDGLADIGVHFKVEGKKVLVMP